MSANLFSFGAGSTSRGVRVWAFNKAQMYSGAPTVQSVFFPVGGGDFHRHPEQRCAYRQARPGEHAQLLLSTELFHALTVYKFHVDWDRISLTAFTGPDVPIAATSWPNAAVANAQRSLVRQQRCWTCFRFARWCRTNTQILAGWSRCGRPTRCAAGDTSGLAAPRWYQVKRNRRHRQRESSAGDHLGPRRRKCHQSIYAESGRRSGRQRRSATALRTARHPAGSRQSSMQVASPPILSTLSVSPSSCFRRDGFPDRHHSLG